MHAVEPVTYHRRGGLYPEGVAAVPIAENGSERLDLESVLADLGKRGVNTVLCEGGSNIAASLLESDLIDEIYWMVAPAILKDQDAIPAVAGRDAVALDLARRFNTIDSWLLGQDTVIHMTRDKFAISH